jgi:hypothetical protein
VQEQIGQMKEAWKNVSSAERSHQKRKREQQKQKDKNEQSMQTMFYKANASAASFG